jgi:hypothetical protein
MQKGFWIGLCVGVKKKNNVMINKIIGFGHLKFFFVSELIIECLIRFAKFDVKIRKDQWKLWKKIVVFMFIKI